MQFTDDITCPPGKNSDSMHTMMNGRKWFLGSLWCLLLGMATAGAVPAFAQLSVTGLNRDHKPRAPRVLTIPEPSTYALAAGAASLALCAWVRRRK